MTSTAHLYAIDLLLLAALVASIPYKLIQGVRLGTGGGFLFITMIQPVVCFDDDTLGCAKARCLRVGFFENDAGQERSGKGLQGSQGPRLDLAGSNVVTLIRVVPLST